MEFLIWARPHGGPGTKLDRRRQHKPIVVVGVFADKIDATRSAKDAWLGCKSSDKIPGQTLLDGFALSLTHVRTANKRFAQNESLWSSSVTKIARLLDG